MRSLHKLIVHVESLHKQGYMLAFTDRSSETLHRIRFVGGYVAFSRNSLWQFHCQYPWT